MVVLVHIGVVVLTLGVGLCGIVITRQCCIFWARGHVWCLVFIEYIVGGVFDDGGSSLCLAS